MKSICNGRHQQSVCNVNHQSRGDTNTGRLPQPHQNQPSNLNVTTTTARTKRGNVLLQTARAFVYNQVTNTDKPVRLLFDSASQRTYITPTTTNNLSIQPIKSETLNLNTFGSETFDKKHCDLYNLQLRTLSGDFVEVKSLSVPSICSPLPIKLNIQNYPYLLELQLADHYEEFEDNAIDILIGADYYWDFISSEQVREEDSPVAINSKFGWLISGPIKGVVNADNSTVTNLIIVSQPINVFEEDSNTHLIDNLRRFWDVESIGIMNTNDTKSDNFSDFMNIRFDDQEQRFQLVYHGRNSYGLTPTITCVSRLHHLKSKLQKTLSTVRQPVPDSDLGEVDRREDKPTTKMDLPNPTTTTYQSTIVWTRVQTLHHILSMC
ncbi:hypothetical protein SNE40_018267 [Patella caerulea]|uniref:DUF1758 domain-containing protein n=1 Tax=Patella caerulea TaxID=87958 RepID=A0AAN8J7C2_PATCE